MKESRSLKIMRGNGEKTVIQVILPKNGFSETPFDVNAVKRTFEICSQKQGFGMEQEFPNQE